MIISQLNKATHIPKDLTYIVVAITHLSMFTIENVIHQQSLYPYLFDTMNLDNILLLQSQIDMLTYSIY